MFRMGISGIGAYLVLSFFSIFPIQKKIVFSSFDGMIYGDNPKALFLALKEKYGVHYRYIWLMDDPCVNIEGAEVIRIYSMQSLYHLATSKLWIHNTRQRLWLKKRKNQFYIQTWHGNIALKKIEKDAQDSLPDTYIQQAMNDSRMANLFLAGSKWNEENYRNAFWYTGEILKSGLPRSDIFFQNPEESNTNIDNIYNIDKNVNVLLYCPTFRNDESFNVYFKDFNRLVKTLEDYTAEPWVVIVRLHPNIQKLHSKIRYSHKILNGSQIADMNELLIRSKIVITDYSSVMFDALMLEKRTFLYVSDLEKYNEERGKYFDLDSLPFPLSSTEEELLLQVTDENLLGKYDKLGKMFLNKCEFYETGEACKRVLERLEKVL